MTTWYQVGQIQHRGSLNRSRVLTDCDHVVAAATTVWLELPSGQGSDPERCLPPAYRSSE